MNMWLKIKPVLRTTHTIWHSSCRRMNLNVENLGGIDSPESADGSDAFGMPSE